MNYKGITRAAAIAAFAFTLAACDSSHENESSVDPVVAQQLLAARADPDRALAEKVARALGNEPGSLPYGVEVTAEDGRVQLWGTVDSTAVRKRLELSAAGVVGVKAIENRLVVDPGA
jgi:osmotically-inducible protein OsmY